ncbi:MAG TPA: AbrB/MazE/SpoVT family DNA-binding domain-containing protein [Sphingomicrobium sp.]|nr:AbrB/MazE/SpoVT family DNA-binding domain-containing protein [Sphingomicrobium sp.]
MNKPLKLIPIGNSTGLIFPKELLRELGAEQGQSISYVKTPNGIELRPYDSEFERQMEVARGVMRRHRAAFRELAK